MSRGKYYNPEIERTSRKEIRQLQNEKLRWQIRRCLAKSEFYREKFRKAGLKAAHIKTVDDLIHVPVVTKQELREEQIKHPPFGRYTVAPAKDWRELHPSTGTTGIPVNTIWSESDVENITEVTARTMYSFGVRPGDVIQNGFSYGLWIAGMSTHYAAKRLDCFVIPIGASMTGRQIDYMLNPGSTVLLCTPSFALHIAENLRERGVSPQKLKLRVGCFGGEAGTETTATRGKIEAGLGIDAYDYYGLAEIGPTFASECTAKAGLHWAEDHYAIEIINPDTMARCAEGEMGVLVITHLTREATPMLRYWTNDYARYDSSRCSCGRTHARSLGGILGRADDMVIYRGAKFYPVQVEKVVRSYKELGDEFVIEMTRDEKTYTDVCTVVCECVGPREDKQALERRLRKALREELMVTPEIRIENFGTLERTTFKAKRIMDKRK
ncbi:MAG: CoA ligase [Syntrophus sp. RIFOXYC2_FULL_54_9]|nr:MAG: CoA ligase [Syntrophus sp. GWC2_56_31]OHE30103.1 MAG: CoA ligase [Syntrophus sp. RIFOXYC2_FULL_54_9]HBB16444.1 CoA ligase [Syntrophus sp. (in: bacteria)]